MPLTTPAEIVTFSLKAAGVLGVGQSALPEDYSDAFDALVAMMNMWNRRRWLVYHLFTVSHLSTGAQSYTVGPAMDFDVPRQDRLEDAFFRQTVNSPPNQVDFPLEIFHSREDYNKIRLKSLASTLPRWIFFDTGWPTGTVYPWPIPSAGLGEVHLTFKATMGPYTSYTQSTNLPPEYAEALWSNLVLRLAPIYQYDTKEEVKRIAAASLETLRTANAQIPRLRMPKSLANRGLGRYDAWSDAVY